MTTSAANTGQKSGQKGGQNAGATSAADLAGAPARTPRWLLVFCYALMGPAGAINGAFVALAVPAMAQYGTAGLLAAGSIGAVLGALPAVWMARRIADGIRERP